eukprot:555825_1
MACYSPHNQYYFPRPFLFGSCADKATKNFLYGCAYGGVISLLFCNPLPRTMKMVGGWGLTFSLAFTRGLYNQPGFLKRTDVFKPDLDRDHDWINKNQIEKWFAREDCKDQAQPGLFG